MSALEVAALLPLAFWVLLTLDRGRGWPWDCYLTRDPEETSYTPEDSSDLPKVIAVVPARNEAAVLPRTLPALLQQALRQGALPET